MIDDEDAGLVQGARLGVVQAALLPEDAGITGWSVAHAWRAAADVSGDLTGFSVASDGRSATVTLGDVMGKGVPAGLLAALLLGSLDVLGPESPAVAVDGAENAVRRRLERASAFATLFHGRVRLGDGALEFVDAGHGFAAIGRRGGGERIRSTDLPIGLQPRGFPRMPRHAVLEPGDVLLVASDGILELPGATFATLTGLAAELTGDAPLEPRLGAFMQGVGTDIDDDLTLLAVRRDDPTAGDRAEAVTETTIPSTADGGRGR